MHITVAIPTYNGAARLPEVILALKNQLQTEGLLWEILVVDNNSKDNTKEVIAQLQATMPQLRSSLETQQGAGFARRRAFWEARGALLAFLDDDNIPDAHWINAVARFAQTHPKAGAYGSRIQADYAVPPPPNFDRIASFLAITERGSHPLLYEKNSRLLPPTAGLVVRKSIWQQYVPPEMVLTGPIEGNMLAGEDLEMLCYIQASPWEIWYNPAMHITHKIPSSRLQKSYLLGFMRGIGLSRYITRTAGIKGVKKYVLTVAYLVNDLRRVMVHIIKYRTKVKTDLIAACEMELYISSLMSLFFLWRKGYLRRKKL